MWPKGETLRGTHSFGGSECRVASRAVPTRGVVPTQGDVSLGGGVAETLLTNESGGQLSPTSLEVAMRAARSVITDLPAGFRFHDLRHYFASMLIASGSDVKVAQARLRHASAKTTLDTYGHLWPDSDDSTRAAVAAVFVARADSLRTEGGTA